MSEICVKCGTVISIFNIGGVIDGKDYCNLCYVERIVKDRKKK